MMHLILAALLVPDIALPAQHKHRHRAHVQHVAMVDRDHNWSAGNRLHWSAIQAEILRAKKQYGAR